MRQQVIRKVGKRINIFTFAQKNRLSLIDPLESINLPRFLNYQVNFTEDVFCRILPLLFIHKPNAIGLFQNLTLAITTSL